MSSDSVITPLEEVVGLLSAQYDIFCSYAHVDNHDGAIDRLIASIVQHYRSLTGIDLKVFQDRSEIITADFWESTIDAALDRSRMLVAFLTPSYLKSEWCKREWFSAEVREEKIRFVAGEALAAGVIIPVKLTSLERARLTKDEELLRNKAADRQWIDLSDVPQRSVKWRAEVRKLVEDIIDQMEYQAQLVPELHRKDTDTFILDSRAKLMWIADVPLVQFSHAEAEQYVTELAVAGNTDWRLPSYEELESLLGPQLKCRSGESATMPLRPPFNKPNYGWLHSGTPVSGQDGHWMMNVSNGHIFNGHGRKAFVRAVRSTENQ